MSEMVMQPVDTILQEMIFRQAIDRKIHLNEGFDEQSIFKLSYWMDKIKKIDDAKEIPINKREPIWICINSFGGKCYELMSILGKIRHFQKMGYKIYTLTTGKAMSCGFLLSLIGDKRYCYEFSTFMQHSVSNYAWGKVQEIKEDLHETERLNNIAKELILERTNITKERLDEVDKCKQDWFINPTEALELGIVDEIL